MAINDAVARHILITQPSLHRLARSLVERRPPVSWPPCDETAPSDLLSSVHAV